MPLDRQYKVAEKHAKIGTIFYGRHRNPFCAPNPRLAAVDVQANADLVAAFAPRLGAGPIDLQFVETRRIVSSIVLGSQCFLCLEMQ